MNSESFDVKQQYKDSSNLNARIALHRNYSTNKTDWTVWLFDQYNLPENARILELGCGPATFWHDNLARVPAGWDITLTDFSAGMLEDAKRKLGQAADRFHFEQVNAEAIPFEDADFDAVMAHHMLYHVPNRPKAFKEIIRVLRPSGKLYAATNGSSHMMVLYDILVEAHPEQQQHIAEAYHPHRLDFRLDNGAEQLEPFFGHVEKRQFEDSLHITDVEPLVDYVLSMPLVQVAEEENKAKLRVVVQNRIATNGAIDIQKSIGVFIATK